MDAFINDKLIRLYIHPARVDSTRAMTNFGSCSEIGPIPLYTATNSIQVLAKFCPVVGHGVSGTKCSVLRNASAMKRERAAVLLRG
jgi:hypothetical protein